MESSGEVSQSQTSEKRPPSLKELQDQLRNLRNSLKNAESDHEFYLSMWKSAPYAVIALVPATVYAYLIDTDYAIGPTVAAFVVAGIGYLGWFRQRTLNAGMSATQMEEEEVRKQLERRNMKVDAEFINLRPNSQLCYYENNMFDDNAYYNKPGEFAAHVPHQIVEDMRVRDGDLFQLHKDFHEALVQEYDKLILFREEAMARLDAMDKSIGVQVKQPEERMPSHIQGLYYILSGIVTTPADVIAQVGETPKIRVPRPGIAHFIQLLLGPEDATNPYPGLLRDTDLKTAAVNLESCRKTAQARYNAIDHMTKVKYGEVAGFELGVIR